jgi:magnesium transporter
MRLLKRMHPPGTAPGTLAEPIEPAGPAKATLITYSSSAVEETELKSPEELMGGEEGQCRWLDVEGHDVDLIRGVGNRLGLHPLVMEDVVNVGQRPKVEEYEECLFMVVDLVTRDLDSGRNMKEQVSIILQENLVVSFRERPGTALEPVRRRLRHGKGRIRTAGSDYLAYALIDTIVDHFFPVLDALGTEIEAVQESFDNRPTPEDRGLLHRIRHDLVLLRRSVWPLQEMLNRIMRSEDPFIRDETKVFYRDVADHLAVVGSMVETYNEMVTGLQDLYLSTVSHELNEVMKVLTIIGSIFIPLSFIAGLYGMNFSSEVSRWNMPELHWYWGYPAALGLMALVAVGLLIFFRRRRWI